MADEIKVGDTVALKCFSGMEMTVGSINPSKEAICYFYNLISGAIEKITIDIGALKK